MKRRKSWQEPSAWLLAGQLLGILMFPFLEGDRVGGALFSIIGIALLGLVVLAVRESPVFTWVVVALSIPTTILLIGQAVRSDDLLLPYASTLEAIIYFYAVYALIRNMLADHVVTRDELYAVGATFTLVAWGFANLYQVCQEIEPGAFIAADDPQGKRTWLELLFLSFTTLTSTGLSDVLPVEPVARAISMLQQIAGLGYVAMVVSRLVALTVYSGSPPRAADAFDGDPEDEHVG